MRNIGLVSLNNGGTMGHMVLLTSLAQDLGKRFPSKKLVIISEYDYKSYSSIKAKNIHYVQIPKQEHKGSSAGCIEYASQEAFYQAIKKYSLKILIFSTFFDPKLVELAKKEDVKCILVTYPLRDTHAEIFNFRKYHSLFDSIYCLEDFMNIKINNAKNASPLFRFPTQKPKKKKEFSILVTCGGGGRPSAEKFFELVLPKLKKIISEDSKVKIIVIKGQHKEIGSINAKVVQWIKNMAEALEKADLIISEAGYFTVMDCVSTGTPAILVPGERRIDNQELRAVEFEKQGCGSFVFHYEEELFYQKIKSFIDDRKRILSCRKRLLFVRKRLQHRKNIIDYLENEIISTKFKKRVEKI